MISMFPPGFITEQRIAVCCDIGSKKRLLETFAELLAGDCSELDSDMIFERLLERERLGSTGLGHGVALPHARVCEVQDSVGAFIQLKESIKFDDQPIDLAFALLVPEDANETHLRLLANLAAMFYNPQLRDKLRQATDASTILDLLTAKQIDSIIP
jgi:PTS system nitrogen regulatory IIA component